MPTQWPGLSFARWAAAAVLVASVLTGLGAPQAQAQAQERSFTFGAVGDHGSNPNSAALLRHVGSAGLSFFQNLGDLSYDTIPAPQWCQFVKDNINAGAGRPAGDPFGETYPFSLVQGNHDTAELDQFVGTSCLPDRLGAIAAPGSTYGRDFVIDYPVQNPLARFIITSPGLGSNYSSGSPLYQWLSSSIDQARASGIRWVIVGNHFNHITMGTKTSEVPAAFFDLVVQKKVDVLVQSHDHTYQRSKQLAHGPACPTIAVGTVDQDCIVDDGSDGSYPAGGGTVLVIAGSGGHSLYPVSSTDPEAGYFATSMGQNSQASIGYTRFTVSETSISSQFVPTGGGTYRDTFSIIGAPAPDTSPPSVPGNVSAAVVSGGVQVGWSASTDDRGVAGYRVARDGVVIASSVTATSYVDTTVAPATMYAYQVQAFDAAGNLSALSSAVNVTTPPATPPGLLHSETWTGANGAAWPSAWTTQTASGTADIQSNAGRLRFDNASGAYARAVLSGAPAEANVDLLMSYRFAETSVRSYFNVFIRGSGGWQNAYRPNNGYGLELSNASASVTVRRSGGGTVTNLASIAAGQQVTTAKQWLRLRVDGSTIAFRIWTDGTPEPSTWTWTGTDTALTTPGQLYLSLVRSSTSTTPKTITLDDLTYTRAGAPAPDTSPPSVPGNVSAAVVSGGVQVGWSASTDDRGVAGYRVARDGVVIASSVTATSYVDTTVAPATMYAYQVQAFDAAGNLSALSSAVNVTTPPATPPGLLHSETWTGANGAAWPSAWTTQTASGTADIQSNAGRLRFDNASGAYARAVLSGAPAEANVDLLMSYRFAETSVRSYFNVFIRGSGGWQNAYRPNNGYGLELSNASASVTVRRSGGGTVTNLASIAAGQQVTTAKQWLRLRVDGSTIAFRIWTDGTPEPSTWTWTGTDTALTTPGQLYLSLVRSSTSTTPKTITLDDLTYTRAGA